jgi:hypothetical protein
MIIENWEMFYELYDELRISWCVRKCYENHMMLNYAYVCESMSMERNHEH